jgi:hypothetical protein
MVLFHFIVHVFQSIIIIIKNILLFFNIFIVLVANIFFWLCTIENKTNLKKIVRNETCSHHFHYSDLFTIFYYKKT